MKVHHVDCLHERCKRCCIVNYLKSHTSRALYLSPDKLLAHVLKLLKEHAPRKDIVVHSVKTETWYYDKDQGGILECDRRETVVQ